MDLGYDSVRHRSDSALPDIYTENNLPKASHVFVWPEDCSMKGHGDKASHVPVTVLLYFGVRSYTFHSKWLQTSNDM